MYPKVRVRDEDGEDDDEYAYGLGYLASLKAFDAFSLSDLTSADESPSSVVRIPMSGSSPKPATSAVSTGRDNKKKIQKSPVPRPRAVLSSPDNDQMIGRGTNKLRKQESRGDHCKIIPGRIKAESPLSGKDFKKPDDGETGLQIKGRRVGADGSISEKNQHLLRNKRPLKVKL